jgi:hypothetical protein
VIDRPNDLPMKRHECRTSREVERPKIRRSPSRGKLRAAAEGAQNAMLSRLLQSSRSLQRATLAISAEVA